MGRGHNGPALLFGRAIKNFLRSRRGVFYAPGDFTLPRGRFILQALRGVFYAPAGEPFYPAGPALHFPTQIFFIKHLLFYFKFTIIYTVVLQTYINFV